MNSGQREGSPLTIAFLLSQLGGRSAQVFANLLEPLKLSPSDAGILRLLSFTPGISQQQLARRLGMHASRLVAIIDAMEERGLVIRREHESDRRTHALELSDAGRITLRAIAGVARSHEEAMLAGMSDAERLQLRALLGKLAELRGLSPGIHPGYRTLGGAHEKASAPKQRRKP